VICRNWYRDDGEMELSKLPLTPQPHYFMDPDIDRDEALMALFAGNLNERSQVEYISSSNEL
jgi:hypothetical protein